MTKKDVFKNLFKDSFNYLGRDLVEMAVKEYHLSINEISSVSDFMQEFKRDFKYEDAYKTFMKHIVKAAPDHTERTA